MSFKKILIFVGFLLFSGSVGAQEGLDKNYYTVKRCSDEWLVYDNDRKDYVPYVEEEHANQMAINLLIDLESNRYYDLLIYTEQDQYLFFDAALQKPLLAGTWQRFKIDSLLAIYRKPQLLLTLYGATSKTTKTVLIGHRKIVSERPLVTQEASVLQLRPRERSSLSNFFVLSMLLLLGFGAFLFNAYPRAFGRFYNLTDLFSFDPRDDSFLVNKPSSRVNLLFIVFTSFIIAYLLFFARSRQYSFGLLEQLANTEKTLLENWADFAFIALAVFLVLIGKYMGLFVVGSLYQLDVVIKRHYFKDIQSSLLFYTVVALLISTASIYVLHSKSLVHYLLVIPSIVFYLFRMAILFFTIRSMVSVKNLYVISYLCITELIPIIIGVRYAL
jgi:Domain of unknown function (DUF4271)